MPPLYYYQQSSSFPSSASIRNKTRKKMLSKFYFCWNYCARFGIRKWIVRARASSQLSQSLSVWVRGDTDLEGERLTRLGISVFPLFCCHVGPLYRCSFWFLIWTDIVVKRTRCLAIDDVYLGHRMWGHGCWRTSHFQKMKSRFWFFRIWWCILAPLISLLW